MGDELYLWGGFSYFDPFTYQDGFRLSHRNGTWEWAPMPDLPSPAAGAGICAIGEKIYHFGGTDYDHERMLTNSDRHGNHSGLGSRLLVLDVGDLDSGWKSASPLSRHCALVPRRGCRWRPGLRPGWVEWERQPQWTVLHRGGQLALRSC